MASAQSQEVLVIGSTGAQGLPVVRAKLPNVSLIKGSQDNQEDLHRAIHGDWRAWVHTDGFTFGEKSELFCGIRAYEIARHERVQDYVYASTDYAVKDANWNEKYHWGHNDAKARVADFILAQRQKGMTKDGKIALIALKDVGAYSLWIFDNIKESAGLQLKVSTDEVSFAEIAATFTEFTGKAAAHQILPLVLYLPMAEPFPHAPANWAAGPMVSWDESTMTWRANFGAW